MIGLQSNDICYSVLQGGNMTFSTDGVTRQSIDPELARTAFDFNIVKRENFDVQGRLIPGQWHLEKENDGSIIPSMSVGDRFEPIQHSTVFDYVVQRVMPELPNAQIQVAGTIHGGGVGLIIIRIGDEFAVSGDESPQHLQLIFNNPTNGMGRMTLGMTTMRLFCENQLVVAMNAARQDGLNVMHTKSGTEIAAFAMDIVHAEAKKGRLLKERIVRMASRQVTMETVRLSLDHIYPLEGLEKDTRIYKNRERLREQVVEQFESGETAMTIKEDNAWKLFNSFTYPVFNPKKMRRTMDRAEIQYSGMFGTRAFGVRQIFEKVESLVI